MVGSITMLANLRELGARDMAIYVLLTLLVALVIYLFYAVIHPERF
jgi:K+-transporting ATPase KdpF subunit